MTMTDDNSATDVSFNAYRRPASARMDALVADVCANVQGYEFHDGLRQRKRRPADQATFEETISSLVCDLTYHYLRDPEARVAITRSNTILGRRSRYRPVAYNKTLPTLLDRLSTPEMDFVDQQGGYEGFAGDGKRTTIAAGTRLIDRIQDKGIGFADLCQAGQELVVLKRPKADLWDAGGYLEYRDTPTTRLFRDQLRRINRWLDAADIAFDEAACPEKPVDPGNRALRRVFTQGRFDSGGRLFGGFWQGLRKKERPDGILIDGEPVVSLDYSQMSPRMLYGLAGGRPPETDAYTLPGLAAYRSGVKSIFNAMLFAQRPLSRMPKGVRQQFTSSVSVTQVTQGILAAHPPLRPFFHCGFGHDLQFRESQILVDVLLELEARRIAALPIHDAVLVPCSARDLTMQVMEEVFHRHVGGTALVKEEGAIEGRATPVRACA